MICHFGKVQYVVNNNNYVKHPAPPLTLNVYIQEMLTTYNKL